MDANNLKHKKMDTIYVTLLALIVLLIIYYFTYICKIFDNNYDAPKTKFEFLIRFIPFYDWIASLIKYWNNLK